MCGLGARQPCQSCFDATYGMHQQWLWFRIASGLVVPAEDTTCLCYSKNTCSTGQSVRKSGFCQNKSVLLPSPNKGYWVRTQSV